MLSSEKLALIRGRDGGRDETLACQDRRELLAEVDDLNKELDIAHRQELAEIRRREAAEGVLNKCVTWLNAKRAYKLRDESSLREACRLEDAVIDAENAFWPELAKWEKR